MVFVMGLCLAPNQVRCSQYTFQCHTRHARAGQNVVVRVLPCGSDVVQIVHQDLEEKIHTRLCGRHAARAVDCVRGGMPLEPAIRVTRHGRPPPYSYAPLLPSLEACDRVELSLGRNARGPERAEAWLFFALRYRAVLLDRPVFSTSLFVRRGDYVYPCDLWQTLQRADITLAIGAPGCGTTRWALSVHPHQLFAGKTSKLFLAQGA